MGRPFTPGIQETINKYFPYLMEIRKRILLVVSGFAIGTVVGIIFYEKIVGTVLRLFAIQGVNIVFTSPFQFINLAISCGFVVGLVIAFPLIILQLLAFLKPALSAKEYRLVISFLPLSILLFLSGFGFGALIMKWQVAIFLGKSTSLGIGNMLDISKLLSVILMTSAFMGVGFQFPIVFSILIRLNIINYAWLAKQRLWAYLTSIIFAMLLPLDSVFADVLLALPLVILFETTLLLNRIVKTRLN